MARVPVYDNYGKTVTPNILFDTGSNKCYISGEFVSRINPPKQGCENLSYVAFGSKTTGPPSLKNIFSVTLRASHFDLDILTTEIPTICSPLVCPEISKHELNMFKNIDFSKCGIMNQRVKIDILIGMDFYWSLIKPNTKRVGNLVAQETVFGWIISGQGSFNSLQCKTAVLLVLLY